MFRRHLLPSNMAADMSLPAKKAFPNVAATPSEAYCGRIAAYLVQKVSEGRIFSRQGWKEKSLPPYAVQIELAATIFCTTFQTSKR
jgi:hypothetical protein